MTTRSTIFFLILFINSIFFSQNYIYVKFSNSTDGKNLKNDFQNQIKQENSLGDLHLSPLIKRVNYTHLKNIKALSRIYKVKFNSNEERNAILSYFSSKTGIEYVEEGITLHIDSAPNDSLISEQWGLNKIGALQLFEFLKVNNITLNDVIVGLVDTGVKEKHPDLTNSLYFNSGEMGLDDKGRDKRFNRIDDDGNGFVDDYRGWDFVDNGADSNLSSTNDFTVRDNDPDDENGHGTLVAGIIGAQQNNGIGVSGVAPNAKILPLRAFNAFGEGEDDDVAAAIIYAVNNGAKIINMSFGDTKYSAVLKDVIDFAYSNGVILIGSSGNASSDLPHYPSSFSGVISVGASDQNDYVASFSNFGSNIDLVAPGVDIISTSKDNGYTSISGTSAATPFVTGSACVVIGLHYFSNEEIKQLFKSTADDINDEGWDLHAGAGRINLFRAVQTLTPGIIKINSPQQNFATSGNEIPINISVLSPYFNHFELYYGTGFNPGKWNKIQVDNSNYQKVGIDIPPLDVTNFADSVYTLRLVVVLNNGQNQEERVNFYVDRTPPQLSLVNLGPAFNGVEPTIISSIVTDEISSVKMYFKGKDQTGYSFITLDEFSSSDKSIQTTHYGFIPAGLIEPDKTYEIYFEAENLAGLKNRLLNNGKPFEVLVEDEFEPVPFIKKNYSLPNGNLFAHLVNLNSEPYVFLNANESPETLSFFKFSQDHFVITDSLNRRLPKSAGDFNGNGKTDILSLFVKNGYIDEQISDNQTKFNNVFTDTSRNFWPAVAMDIDNDGMTEIISFNQNSAMDIWQVSANLTLSLESEINIFDTVGVAGFIGVPNVAVDDIDNDGNNEIWTMDNRGSLYSIIVNGPNKYTKGKKIDFNLSGIKNILTSGDYDGDGRNELAVLLKSSSFNDIAPFYILYIFNLNNNNINILTSKAFLDVSSKFPLGNFVKVNYSLNFADIDNDNSDELLINIYPYFYIMKKTTAGDRFVYFDDGVNSKNIFVGDLDNNGIKDIGLSSIDSVRFFEMNTSNNLTIPVITKGYSKDSNHIYIEWKGNGNIFRIFRNDSIKNLTLIDSTSDNYYMDSVLSNRYYFYSVQSYDNAKNKYSGLSNVKKIFSHQPAKLINVDAKSSKNLIAEFNSKISGRVTKVIDFVVDSSIYPNSVIINNDNSYLLNFIPQLKAGLHSLKVNGLVDFYGSPVDSNSINFTVSTVEQKSEFFITKYALLNSNHVLLQFNLDVDKLSAMNKDNYDFNPANKIKGISIDPDSSSKIIIATEYPVGSIGKKYTLKIKNLVSSEATGKIPINDGAGSSVFLSSFANNLDNVYNYPNPVKLTENQFVTFANLTKSCEIYIFTLNGKPINKLVENNGDGGLSWDLTNENGIKIDSGIYLYIVRTLDGNKNVTQEKIGKIAVIK